MTAATLVGFEVGAAWWEEAVGVAALAREEDEGEVDCHQPPLLLEEDATDATQVKVDTVPV